MPSKKLIDNLSAQGVKPQPMPIADPDRRREVQRAIHRDRSRGVAIYRAALTLCRCRAGWPEWEKRFWAMIEAELQWREAQGIPLPKWPTTREKQLLEGATAHDD